MRFVRSFLISAALGGLTCVSPLGAQEMAPILKIETPHAANHVTALLRDRRGKVWVGSEGGLWRFDPAAAPDAAWKKWGVADGMGDDYTYALLEDRQGRIWAGHASGGVSVWNGREWANYSVVQSEDNPKMRLGPLSERVFALALNPADGGVWLATAAGLCQYDPKNNGWNYRTRRDGMPSDQITALAFDSFGTLYAGTACDGLAIAHADSLYRDWTNVRGADFPPPNAAGAGLPSNQINDILVSDDDTVFVATKCGLARSSDLGANWTYLRGADWKLKSEGRTRKVAPTELPGDFGREILREDYVSNLVEDPNGLLLIGYRMKGWEARRPLPDRVPYVSAKNEKDQFPYVSAILPQNGAPPLLGSYPGGVTLGEAIPAYTPDAREREVLAAKRGWKIAPALPATIAPLPASAKAPTPDEIDALLKPFSALGEPLGEGEAVYEGDDWRTKGDWVGRYGRQYTVMCAARAPLDHYFYLDTEYKVEGRLGPHVRGDDSLRHWVHWVKTDNPNTLYDPIIGYRRQSEWDDHGETYPLAWEGPDVWAKVTVPTGVHRLSLHFFNKDGLGGFNRARDYFIEVKKGDLPLEEADVAPALATAQVRDFWNAVYKRFIVRGPATYWVKVGRDGSFNTILDAVFIDKITGPHTWADARPLSYFGRHEWDAPQWETMTYEASPQEAAVKRARVWEWKLDAALGRKGGVEASEGTRVLALRALMAMPKTQVPPQLLARWRWKSQIWNKRDRAEWQTAMEAGREAWFQLVPTARDAEW